MNLSRMGSFHQTRLSFMRALLRKLKSDQWQFERVRWQVDARGIDVALYRATGPEHTYTLVCFANDLPPEKRTDRVIAEEWDATFALYDGEPSQAEIDRLADNIPLQEAGQCQQTELVLAIAKPKFAITVDCRSAHQVAHLIDHFLVRLLAGR